MKNNHLPRSKVSIVSIFQTNSIAQLIFFQIFTFLIYYPGIFTQFFFDDTVRIVSVIFKNGIPQFQLLEAYSQGLGQTLRKIMPERPVLMFTIWLNALLSGSSPIGYKITNIVLHGANGFLVFQMLRFLAKYFKQNTPIAVSLLLSLLFVAHPLNSQAVLMVIQRGTLLSFFFAIFALYFSLIYCEEKKNVQLFSAFAFFLLAELSKLSVATLPVIVLLFCFNRNSREQLIRVFSALCLALFLPMFGFFAMRLGYYKSVETASRWFEYGFAQAEVVFFYFQKFFLPLALNITYPISADLSSNFTVRCFLALLHSLILIFCFKAGIFRRKIWALGVLAIYLALSVESSFFPIPHIVFDHRMYFPMLFILFVLQTSFNSIFREKLRFGIGVSFLVLYCLFFSLITRERIAETKTYFDWAKNSATKFRNDPLGNLSLLQIYWNLGKDQEGLAESSELLKRYPKNSDYLFYKELFSSRKDFNRIVRNHLHHGWIETSNGSEEVLRNLEETISKEGGNDFLNPRATTEEYLSSLFFVGDLENFYHGLNHRNFLAYMSSKQAEKLQMGFPVLFQYYRSVANQGGLNPFQIVLWANFLKVIREAPEVSWKIHNEGIPILVIFFSSFEGMKAMAS